MGTTGTILVVLGAWLVGSVFLGVVVGRMLRFGRRPPEDVKPPADDHDPPPIEPPPPPRDAP
jgi:hypothetical protein